MKPQYAYAYRGTRLVRMFIRDLINIPEAYNHIQFQTHIFKKSSFAVQCTCKGGFYYERTKTLFGNIGIEWRLLIKCLNEARLLFLDNGNPVEDIDELLIKAFKMKHKKVRI